MDTRSASSPSRPGGPCVLTASTELPLTFADGHLLTPMMVDGVSMNMILDTGSNATTLTLQAAQRLRVRMTRPRATATGLGGMLLERSFNADEIRLGEMQRHDFTMLVADFDLRSPHATADGLLGSDLLSAYEVDLDLLESKAILYQAGESCHRFATVLAEPLYQAPIVAVGNGPQNGALVHVVVDGQTLTALVDTGSPGTFLFRNSAQRVGLDLNALDGDRHFTTGGTGPKRVAAVLHRLARLKVGEITMRNLPVAIVDQRTSDDVDMVLGLNFLARVHAWLDFHNGALLMQYPPAPSSAG